MEIAELTSLEAAGVKFVRVLWCDIDQHAHNLLKPEARDRYPYPAAFTEGHDPDIVNFHARHTLYYRRSLRDISALLDCEPTEESILFESAHLGWE